MNKNNKFLIIGLVSIIAIAAVGGIFFLNQNSSSSGEAAMTSEKTMENENPAMEADPNRMTGEQNSSSYAEYSANILENTADNKRVLFFYASWCPICRPVDTALKENANLIPSGVSVIRVNFNDPDTDQEEKDLAKKYGVTNQHTFVQIDENGNELNKWNGGKIREILTSLK